MTGRDTVNAICAALPGAEHSDPWGGGHDCWKVGGKMFAVIGAVNEAVAVKTEGIETAEMLIEIGPARRAAYFHRSWIELSLDAPTDELRHRIEASYRLIRDKLPRKVQSALPAPPTTQGAASQ
ncbi:MmcQ/YjbR family DNA-binding protein [Paracoccus sp. M683]|uniref:MmcQ/YjbR family DNA-binding protein n=1 Tax=Paracoccus sp. M683 TaxID=2594268 RepID=UPI00117E870D|nr:MmcQ/YjbR family DNA-binding protein [Paracoccus sp. M683]TRW95165.1 MmcQ/YjbR family DNA-binding protein [Paracoccus sp. M683]